MQGAGGDGKSAGEKGDGEKGRRMRRKIRSRENGKTSGWACGGERARKTHGVRVDGEGGEVR